MDVLERVLEYWNNKFDNFLIKKLAKFNNTLAKIFTTISKISRKLLHVFFWLFFLPLELMYKKLGNKIKKGKIFQIKNYTIYFREEKLNLFNIYL